jgi:hypothetical protein
LDYWVVKLDGGGSIQWQKCLGGTHLDEAYSVQQTVGGGYVVAGRTRSNDGDVTGNHDITSSYYDCWIVKLDNSGNTEWQKCLGGTDLDGAYSVQQTSDAGYIVAGYSASNDGDVTGHHDTTVNYSDCWIVKLNNSGNIQWQQCLGGTAPDQAYSVDQTTDGGYVVAG